ncbi:hypothetical protein [Altericista sp. CCNU0014]|uniref:hypothetical protein n=1 Tax=Altericista sp. CCNU0014 TaxID=3082949 RepID=UPI00384F2894
MKDQSTSLDEQNVDYDAELLKEAIAEDEEKTPSTNVQKDYEQSKAFSTPSQERDPEEISPSLGSSFNPENKQSESSAEGNPENFRAMAQEVNPQADE